MNDYENLFDPICEFCEQEINPNTEFYYFSKEYNDLTIKDFQLEEYGIIVCATCCKKELKIIELWINSIKSANVPICSKYNQCQNTMTRCETCRYKSHYQPILIPFQYKIIYRCNACYWGIPIYEDAQFYYRIRQIKIDQLNHNIKIGYDLYLCEHCITQTDLSWIKTFKYPLLNIDK